jgi:hypothetical protein
MTNLVRERCAGAAIRRSRFREMQVMDSSESAPHALDTCTGCCKAKIARNAWPLRYPARATHDALLDVSYRSIAISLISATASPFSSRRKSGITTP